MPEQPTGFIVRLLRRINERIAKAEIEATIHGARLVEVKQRLDTLEARMAIVEEAIDDIELSRAAKQPDDAATAYLLGRPSNAARLKAALSQIRCRR